MAKSSVNLFWSIPSRSRGCSQGGRARPAPDTSHPRHPGTALRPGTHRPHGTLLALVEPTFRFGSTRKHRSIALRTQTHQRYSDQGALQHFLLPTVGNLWFCRTERTENFLLHKASHTLTESGLDEMQGPAAVTAVEMAGSVPKGRPPLPKGERCTRRALRYPGLTVLRY